MGWYEDQQMQKRRDNDHQSYLAKMSNIGRNSGGVAESPRAAKAPSGVKAFFSIVILLVFFIWLFFFAK